jgi:hypothetical protein
MRFMNGAADSTQQWLSSSALLIIAVLLLQSHHVDTFRLQQQTTRQQSTSALSAQVILQGKTRFVSNYFAESVEKGYVRINEVDRLLSLRPREVTDIKSDLSTGTKIELENKLISRMHVH